MAYAQLGRDASLEAWLTYIENINEKPLELGLVRMREMIRRLGIRFDCPVFTVAGTNGKGSTCMMLESVLRSAGYRVATHTSPHLIRFNERARIDGVEVDDTVLVSAFCDVEQARGGLALTYFEFTGLAVLLTFMRSKPDAVVLEIGLGGRLDAINALDPDCSIVCAIGIDHAAYLGNTRESVAAEKACIYRAGRPAICTDRNAPKSLVDYAASIGAKLQRYGIDYETQEAGTTFSWRNNAGLCYEQLPSPSLFGAQQIQNAAGVIAALTALSHRLTVTREDIARGMTTAFLPGRFEQCVLADGTELILDVGHNPQAAESLAANMQASGKPGLQTWAVYGMLKDKDMRSVACAMAKSASRWFVASLTGPRAATAVELSEKMREAGIDATSIQCFDTVSEALSEAVSQRGLSPDLPVRILVFGSFLTVAAAKEFLACEPSLLRGKTAI